MFPILYEQITAGIVPEHNGLGVLSDCSLCECEQIKNDKYEIVFEYPITGIHAQEIAERRVIKIKANPTDDPQLFRIKRISKVMNGKVTVYCRHISYDLSGYEITSGSASSAAGACLLLQGSANGYTITTDKTVQAEFKIDTPASVRSYFGGKAGSFLDVFGKTEIKYDNFNVQFLLNAGADRGVQIRYAKNLLELSQETDCDNLYTHVLCYWKKDDITVVGTKVSTGLNLDVPKTLIVDSSSDFDTEPSVSDLTNKATQYVSEHNLTTPTNNIVLDFVQSGELKDRVDLCDTVSVYYEALGITRTNVQCIRTKYDCLREKYIETEFGDIKPSLTDTISAVKKDVAEKPSTTVMEQAIQYATALITGALGGCVINGHDSNNDGIPDENLILNTQDIATATRVIRSNIGGIGFSKNGYAGPYQTAIGFDGIVADAITTGILNANLIKAGVLSDVNGNSTIDMTTGIARLFQLVAKRDFTIVDSEDNIRGFISTTVGGGIALRFNDSTGAKYVVRLEQENNRGYLYLSNGNGDIKARIEVAEDNGATYGKLELFNNNGDKTIELDGENGRAKVKTAFDKVYEGSLSAIGDWWTFDTHFAGLLIEGKVTSSGSRLTTIIPVEMIDVTPARYQLADETNWISFDCFLDGNLIKIEIKGKNSSGFIERVYGLF